MQRDFDELFSINATKLLPARCSIVSHICYVLLLEQVLVKILFYVFIRRVDALSAVDIVESSAVKWSYMASPKHIQQMQRPGRT